jgi:hypothetical protein
MIPRTAYLWGSQLSMRSSLFVVELKRSRLRLFTYWPFEGGFALAHLDYYNLEILCLIAWVIKLTALLPLFVFINDEFAGNLSHKPLSEVTMIAGIFTYKLNTFITSLSEVPVGIIST